MEPMVTDAAEKANELGMYSGQLPIVGRDTPTHGLREGRLNLAHSFRGLSPWSAGSKAGISWQKGLVEHSCSVHGGQEQRQGGKGRGLI